MRRLRRCRRAHLVSAAVLQRRRHVCAGESSVMHNGASLPIRRADTRCKRRLPPCGTLNSLETQRYYAQRIVFVHLYKESMFMDSLAHS